jgi:hypothetical protein
MGKTVRFGETETFELRNKSIKSINIAVTGKHTTAATSFAGTLLKTEEVNVKATLKRKGKTHVIFNELLKPLLLATNFLNEGFSEVTGSGVVKLLQAAGVKEERTQRLTLNFGTILNLKGDDLLIFEIKVPNSAVGTGVDVNTSSLYVNFDEAVGYEYGIPNITSRSITPNKTRVSESLGDNVHFVHLINMDKNSNLASDEVVTTVTMSSDRLDMNDDNNELECKRIQQFQTGGDSNSRNNSWQLHGGQQIDNVDLELTLVGTNVNASENFIVVTRMLVTADNLARVRAMKAKHSRSALAKIN